MTDEVDVGELMDRAEELEASGRWEEALDAWAEVVACYDDGREITSAGAQTRRVWLLATHHRRAEAIAAADQLSAELADADLEGALAGHLTYALYWRARCLNDLGRADEALQAFQDLAGRFGSDATPEVRRHVIPAYLQAASLLQAGGRPSDAVDAYDEVLVALSDAAEDEFTRDWTVGALRGKAASLEAMGRDDEAVLVLDAAVGRLYDPAEMPDGPASLSAVLEGKGRLLVGLERFEDAGEAFDQIAELARSHPELRDRAVIALTNKVAVCNRLGRVDEALATHEQLMAEFSEEVVAAYDAAIRNSGGLDKFRDREGLAGALAGKASALASLGRLAEAIAALDQLIETFADESRDPVAEAVRQAREMREMLERQQDEPDDPEEPDDPDDPQPR